MIRASFAPFSRPKITYKRIKHNMSTQTPPNNKNPARLKISALIGIAVLLFCVITTTASAYTVSGAYPKYHATPIFELISANRTTSPSSQLQNWNGSLTSSEGSYNYFPFADKTYDFTLSANGDYRYFGSGNDNVTLRWGQSMYYTTEMRQALGDALKTLNDGNQALSQYDFRQFGNAIGVAQTSHFYNSGNVDANIYILDSYAPIATAVDLLPYSLYYTTYVNPTYIDGLHPTYKLYVTYDLTYRNTQGKFVSIHIEEYADPHAEYENSANELQNDYNLGKYFQDKVTAFSDYAPLVSPYVTITNLTVSQTNACYAYRLNRLCGIYDDNDPHHAQDDANVYVDLVTSEPYRITVIADPPNLTSIGNFLGSAATAFFGMQIFPGITLGWIFIAIIGIAILITFLKIFAGG